MGRICRICLDRITLETKSIAKNYCINCEKTPPIQNEVTKKYYSKNSGAH